MVDTSMELIKRSNQAGKTITSIRNTLPIQPSTSIPTTTTGIPIPAIIAKRTQNASNEKGTS